MWLLGQVATAVTVLFISCALIALASGLCAWMWKEKEGRAMLLLIVVMAVLITMPPRLWFWH